LRRNADHIGAMGLGNHNSPPENVTSLDGSNDAPRVSEWFTDVKNSQIPLIHHQGIICGVAFDRPSLRRIGPYASVVTPRRLASNTLLVIRRTA